MGLKINQKKCVFSVSILTFAGHKISAKGISADPKKIDTIQKIKTPPSSSEVKLFLGMINYCHQYIRDYSTISAPLQLLTKKNQLLVRKQEQQDTSEKLKSSLNNHVVMAFYNPNAIIHLVNEASPVGLEAILAKQEADGLLGPITFSSRSTTDVESRYSQTEQEALAVLWGCQHFHHYVFDKHIVINTDHKPLVRLLSLNSNPPPHIQCWILHLEAYNYTI